MAAACCLSRWTARSTCTTSTATDSDLSICSLRRNRAPRRCVRGLASGSAVVWFCAHVLIAADPVLVPPHAVSFACFGYLDAHPQIPIVGISWYDGAEGNADPLAPTLAIAFENGRVQVHLHPMLPHNVHTAPHSHTRALPPNVHTAAQSRIPARVRTHKRLSLRDAPSHPTKCTVSIFLTSGCTTAWCGVLRFNAAADHAKRGRRRASVD